MIHILRIILWPLTLLFWIGTSIRNHLFNIGYTRSFDFQIPVVNVGNLAVGGSGKTPMVEYLIRLLKSDAKLATLSRGYGRKTRGFILADDLCTPDSIGDEPYQYFRKFGKEVFVSVGEDRAMAIPEIIFHRPETEIILMDDAYQHRTVVPQLNLLLTRYEKPFYSDFLMPSGRLRESRVGARRADAIIVTKCPDLHPQEMDDMTRKVRRYGQPNVPVFFARLVYGKPTDEKGNLLEINTRVVGVSGLAHNEAFEAHLQKNYSLQGFRGFPDHVHYQEKEVRSLVDQVKKHQAVLMTTEKDWVKLIQPEFSEILKEISMFYVPVEHRFLDNGILFDAFILNSIKKS